MGKKKVIYDYKEEFTKADQASYENSQIQDMIKELLEANQDNKALMEYVELLKKFEENKKVYDEAKKNMYESMEKSGEEILEGISIIATLTHPYTKSELDEDRLKTDLGIEKYATYVIQKPVKGNVKFKPKEEI